MALWTEAGLRNVYYVLNDLEQKPTNGSDDTEKQGHYADILPSAMM